MANEPVKHSVSVYDSSKNGHIFLLTGQAIHTHPPDSGKIACTCSIGLISDKEIISYSFDVPKGLPETELDDTVEIRMYQDAGLNHMIDYKIVYAVRDSLLDIQNHSVTAFALPPVQSDSRFASFREQCDYIDAILPGSTLPFSLYSAEILEPRHDIFIYIKEEETTFALFSEGRFVYAKSIGNGLRGLHGTFVKENNEGIDYDTFITALTRQGVDPMRFNDDPVIFHRDIAALLERSLGEINNIIQYARRIAGIQGIDRVFIGTQHGTVPGLESLVATVTGIRGESFHFFTPFYSDEDPYVDQTVILALIEAENVRTGRRPNPFNLSVYPRPPGFFRRDSGRLLLSSAAAVLLFGAYPLFLAVDTHWKSRSYDTTMDRLHISQEEFVTFKENQKEIQKRRNRYTALLQAEQQRHGEQITLLKRIDAKQNSHRSKTRTLALLFQLLTRHRLKIETLAVDADRYRLDLRSAKDAYVTAFLKSISRHKKMHVDMDTYAYNPAINAYRTSIRIEVTP